MTKFKTYCIVNRYYMGIQAGIQAAHAMHALAGADYSGREYLSHVEKLRDEWLLDPEGIPMCVVKAPGGHGAVLDYYHDITYQYQDQFPMALFIERANNDSASCIAVALPEEYWDLEIFKTLPSAI